MHYYYIAHIFIRNINNTVIPSSRRKSLDNYVAWCIITIGPSDRASRISICILCIHYIKIYGTVQYCMSPHSYTNETLKNHMDRINKKKKKKTWTKYIINYINEFGAGMSFRETADNTETFACFEFVFDDFIWIIHRVIIRRRKPCIVTDRQNGQRASVVVRASEQYLRTHNIIHRMTSRFGRVRSRFDLMP